MEDSTAEEKDPKNHPPTVITVDTGVKKEEETESHEDRPSTNSETETRTPKHANKSLAAAKSTADGSTTQKGAAANTDSHDNRQKASTGAAHPQSQSFFAPRPYEGNMGGPNGAFQPHDRLTHQHNQLMAMQARAAVGAPKDTACIFHG